MLRFNPRAPRGTRPADKNLATKEACFNPRAPRGTRHVGDPLPLAMLVVSIHAPRAGRDGDGEAAPFEFVVFQSTRPARDATMSPTATPTAGTGFNPRAPRGTRPGRQHSLRDHVRFNPRAPRGTRLRAARNGGAYRPGFNPRAPRGTRLGPTA